MTKAGDGSRAVAVALSLIDVVCHASSSPRPALPLACDAQRRPPGTRGRCGAGQTALTLVLALTTRRSRCRKDSIPRLGSWFRTKSEPRECVARSWRSNLGPSEPSPDSSPRLAGRAAEREPQPRYARTESEGTLRTTVSGGMMGRDDSEGQEASIGENCRDRWIASLTDRL